MSWSYPLPRSQLRPRVGSKLGDRADAFSQTKGLAFPVPSKIATSPRVCSRTRRDARDLTAAQRFLNGLSTDVQRSGLEGPVTAHKRVVGVCLLVAEPGGPDWNQVWTAGQQGGGRAVAFVIAASSPSEAASRPRGHWAVACSGPGLLSPAVSMSHLRSRLADLHRVLGLRGHCGDTSLPLRRPCETF